MHDFNQLICLRFIKMFLLLLINRYVLHHFKKNVWITVKLTVYRFLNQVLSVHLLHMVFFLFSTARHFLYNGYHVVNELPTVKQSGKKRFYSIEFEKQIERV